jgi:NodT family efflux transporter outer membrane factor (OMF) lipoprotein
MSKQITFLLLSIVLSACSAKDIAVKPETVNPSGKWMAGDEEGAVADGWIRTFKDPLLDELVEEALNNNFDLRIAAANLDIAVQNAVKAGALLKPMADIIGIYKRSQNFTDNTTGNTTKGAALDISWELDIWGRISAAKKAASLEAEASAYDLAFARRSLAAQTAKGYLLSILAKLQKDLANSFVKNYQEILNIVRSRYDAGSVSEQDLHLAKADLMSAKEAYVQAQEAYEEALRSLEMILGRYPSAEIEVAKALPKIPGVVPAGLPSQLLARRPDIVAASSRVMAAFRKEEEARKAMLPRIALTSQIGHISQELSEVIDLTKTGANLAANFLAPVFQGGQLAADVRIANAQQKAAVAQFNTIVLNAFGEVENALSNEETFSKREAYLTEVLEENERAVKIARIQYENGAVDLLSVLQLQVRADNTRIELLNVQNERLIQRINLHLALGGDFW